MKTDLRLKAAYTVTLLCWVVVHLLSSASRKQLDIKVFLRHFWSTKAEKKALRFHNPVPQTSSRQSAFWTSHHRNDPILEKYALHLHDCTVRMPLKETAVLYSLLESLRLYVGISVESHHLPLRLLMWTERIVDNIPFIHMLDRLGDQGERKGYNYNIGSHSSALSSDHLDIEWLYGMPQLSWDIAFWNIPHIPNTVTGSLIFFSSVQIDQ